MNSDTLLTLRTRPSGTICRLNVATGIATNPATASGPVVGVAVETVSQRVGFTKVVLTNGSPTAMLNGWPECVANLARPIRVPAGRRPDAACAAVILLDSPSPNPAAPDRAAA